MGDSPKFTFGTSAKQQVAARLQAHVAANFHNNSSKAAEDLGISRQRLFSYVSGKTLPRAPMFDVIFKKWGLNLLGISSGPQRRHRADRGNLREHQQPSLFDHPVTLKSDDLRVVIKRKGPRLVASIEIAAEVEIA